MGILSDHKHFIDRSDYETLLRRWRDSPCGDPIFQGETGDYYEKAMSAKKSELPAGEAARISKKIGWRCK